WPRPSRRRGSRDRSGPKLTLWADLAQKRAVDKDFTIWPEGQPEAFAAVQAAPVNGRGVGPSLVN
ncbi:MAG TPA: hypothetical protein VME46_09890, partial [Acidimicrobiales bacterium]|nr:hypothetical protein [Acidimicrobiales bacterium]